MRLTIPEQVIIKCIITTKAPVTRHHIIVHTGLNFATTDQCLARLVVTGRLALQADGGFVLTALAKCNPVVKLMLQEKVEERLWMGGGPQSYRVMNRLVSIIHDCLRLSGRNAQ